MPASFIMSDGLTLRGDLAALAGLERDGDNMIAEPEIRSGGRGGDIRDAGFDKFAGFPLDGNFETAARSQSGDRAIRPLIERPCRQEVDLSVLRLQQHLRDTGGAVELVMWPVK